jgi:Pyruvate/2-oxoacid:ferredoxin oxidoreductase delta subunit
MTKNSWFTQISTKQRILLSATLLSMLLIIISGVILPSSPELKKTTDFNINMSIKDIAPELGVTGKSLARELNLPLNISKQKDLKTLGVSAEELEHVAEHLLSHSDSMLKYYVYVALVLGGLVFLVWLGRPDSSDIKNRHLWYPRTPYNAFLIISVVVAGFLLGKSPNPMESVVKVFKSMVGLYPDPMAKVIAFVLFIVLAVIGNKIICGWACPFGALQELFYSLPILRKIKQKKIPFYITNTIRGCLFLAVLLLLFGVIGGRKGLVIYHYLNPFNLFDLHFESSSILITVIIVLVASFFVYRPFCQLICPFGFISWLIERISIFRVRIDMNKCTRCGICIKKCPTDAVKGIIEGKKMPADCFSCARCLNVCPVDAIKYSSKKQTR